ncbi:hypothetical protein [Kitasatospora sp. NPDC090091]|uniref:hypothetical protein n=1 Tax=Kitasatospora sp. NPDC090091 TaxID=3364081 RepID=UPI00382E2F5C
MDLLKAAADQLVQEGERLAVLDGGPGVTDQAAEPVARVVTKGAEAVGDLLAELALVHREQRALLDLPVQLGEVRDVLAGLGLRGDGAAGMLAGAARFRMVVTTG